MPGNLADAYCKMQLRTSVLSSIRCSYSLVEPCQREKHCSIHSNYSHRCNIEAKTTSNSNPSRRSARPAALASSSPVSVSGTSAQQDDHTSTTRRFNERTIFRGTNFCTTGPGHWSPRVIPISASVRKHVQITWVVPTTLPWKCVGHQYCIVRGMHSYDRIDSAIDGTRMDQ